MEGFIAGLAEAGGDPTGGLLDATWFEVRIREVEAVVDCCMPSVLVGELWWLVTSCENTAGIVYFFSGVH